MRKFILTANIPDKKDLFQMSESKQTLDLYCESFINLMQTIRATKPIGFKSPSMRRFRKLLKGLSELELINPFFLTKLYKIKEVKTPPAIATEIDFITRKGNTLTLKVIKKMDAGRNAVQ